MCVTLSGFVGGGEFLSACCRLIRVGSQAGSRGNLVRHYRIKVIVDKSMISNKNEHKSNAQDFNADWALSESF
jgi:hypothetical protein